MAKKPIQDTDELDAELYSIGLSLGFSLKHIRNAIDGADSRKLLLRKWIALGKDEVYFIASGWPDYTNDPFRAMREEPPPFSETAEEEKDREHWLALAGLGKEKKKKRKRRPRIVRRERCTARMLSESGFRVVRCKGRPEGESAFCAEHRVVGPDRSFRPLMPLVPSWMKKGR